MESELINLIADLGTIAASLAVIVTTVFVWRQLGLQAQDVDTDARRFQRESLSVIHETLQDERFLTARSKFFSGPHQRSHSELSDEEKRGAKFILSVYGLMTRMVASKAIDEALYQQYWGFTLMRDWDRLENFISGERLASQSHGLYRATEDLVSRWERGGS